MARQIEPTNRYRDVLLKLIPTEIVGAYMVTDGLIPTTSPGAKWIALGASVFLFFLTPVYLKKLYRVTNWTQIAFTTGSFVIWIYWMGGPFKLWGIHLPPLASILLVLWTLLVPLFNLPSAFNRGQRVQILAKKPTLVAGKDYAVIWNAPMNKFLGKVGKITEVDARKKAVRIDADGGQYWWSFDWLKPKKSNEGEL